PQQELRGTQRGGPELGIELAVAQLAPGSLVREEDRTGLVELMPAPRRSKRAVRPVALEPESLRFLRAWQPAQRAPRKVVPAGGEEREHDEGEITPPHEAVAAGALELGVELGRRDH